MGLWSYEYWFTKHHKPPEPGYIDVYSNTCTIYTKTKPLHNKVWEGGENVAPTPIRS